MFNPKMERIHMNKVDKISVFVFIRMGSAKQVHDEL